PALDRGLPPPERLDGARAERERREAGRARQALLRTAVGRVDAPAVDLHRHAAERGHAVGEEERAVVVRQPHRVLEGLPRAGGRPRDRGRAECARAARRRQGPSSRRRTVHEGGPRLQIAAVLPAALVARLRAVVGADGVIDRPEALLVYECDGYTLERA